MGDVTQIDLKLFWFSWASHSVWGRLWNGYGLLVKTNKAPVFFSERYGYTKYFKLFGLKFRLLKPATFC